MVLTRRNTLILLFTVVAAAGVIGGTGAFSTVEADRTVDINTAGDSSGNVIIEVNDDEHESLTNDGSGDTIGFDFDQVNLDAKTTYNDVLNVTINDQDGETGDYQISTTTPDGMNVEFSNGQSSIETSAGTLEQANVTIDTTGDFNSADADVSDGTITFTVTAQ